MDNMPIPKIVTTVKIGNFKLYVYAYRTITKEEALICRDMWLVKNKRKTFPKSGSSELITIFGYNLE